MTDSDPSAVSRVLASPPTVMIPSHRPKLVQRVVESLAPLPTVHVDGTGYPSFSKLMNDCIVRCAGEIVVVCSDKVMPSPAGIERMMTLLEEGYAAVGVYYFACVAFPKELVRRIGFFDERFVGGECEDSDYMLRMKEADVAYYLTKEAPYTPMASSWSNALSRAHFARKWGTMDMVEARRQLPEERYAYDLGPGQSRSFLPSSRCFESR